jgi:uncharacterized membrane protein
MSIHRIEIQKRNKILNAGISAGFVLGIGLGGMIDGIVLHQIIQWHNMGSAVLPPFTMQAMSKNMRWDGLFHLAMFIVTLTGVMMLRREGRDGITPRLKCFIGQMLLGWGVFNLIEGLIDHQLLGLHHIHDLPGYIAIYDWLFLGIGGVLLIVIGWSITLQAPQSTLNNTKL